MALERVPADIRAEGGVARMSDPEMIQEIKEAVTIPVMAKARIGHFVEAQILEALGVDYIDESEVLTPADEQYHIEKHNFKVPFVCGSRDLGEALRRIGEGAAMIRSKGEPGTGNIVEAVRHLRTIIDAMRRLTVTPPEEQMTRAKGTRRAVRTGAEVAKHGKLPSCSSARAASPRRRMPRSHAARRGGVFVGSGIFKSCDPARRGRRSSRPSRISGTRKSSPVSPRASAIR